MLLFIARRLVWTAVVLLAVLLLTFLVFFKLPAGDPAPRFAGPRPTQESLALIRERLHLDQPWYVQFGYFVKNFVAGDEHGWPGLGYSYGGFVPVKDLVMERAPRTLWLIFGAATLWLVIGVGIGVLSAVKRRSVLDRGAMGFALFGISAPVFWLGLMALFVVWRESFWLGGTDLGFFTWPEHLTGGTGYARLTDGVGVWVPT